jgi:hypothetical protein
MLQTFLGRQHRWLSASMSRSKGHFIANGFRVKMWENHEIYAKLMKSFRNFQKLVRSVFKKFHEKNTTIFMNEMFQPLVPWTRRGDRGDWVLVLLTTGTGTGTGRGYGLRGFIYEYTRVTKLA